MRATSPGARDEMLVCRLRGRPPEFDAGSIMMRPPSTIMRRPLDGSHRSSSSSSSSSSFALSNSPACFVVVVVVVVGGLFVWFYPVLFGGGDDDDDGKWLAGCELQEPVACKILARGSSTAASLILSVRCGLVCLGSAQLFPARRILNRRRRLACWLAGWLTVEFASLRVDLHSAKSGW